MLSSDCVSASKIFNASDNHCSHTSFSAILLALSDNQYLLAAHDANALSDAFLFKR
jgi:hypothetical protein